MHSQANGAGWCFCVAWWTPGWEGWGERTAEENYQLRQALLERGEYDGYLLYVEGAPAGWCQVGPRDRLAKLAQQFELGPDPDVWAISCFFIAPAYRRQGLAARLLAEVLADLQRRGVHRVEAFPKRGPELDALELWNGPEEMFRAAGFEVAQDDPRRPVLELRIED
ncbi:MAG: GNAT family N-acetyltransferase [Chloroflexi bacterium]|nr:GNAT family N-acetyltransferase [Chloroflexota bacterium]MCI0579409.1 GNAT family N-acetyltransferase [Chloroflexota bacterium]MCI0648944.1 GNAT family N-acetyltransferase [Chloroflexota bacterium]MCI0731777.1 GNAT family N-acetyltransferase [Chloroflexota bacterium]